jgi:hypothetical protein
MKTAGMRNESGATLLVALFTALIIGAVLGSFLLVTSSRTKLTLRSSAWNAAVPVLEAGIEEAFTHLHDDTNNYRTNGWALTNIGGQPVYAKTRSFKDGSYFYTTIYGAKSSGPIIYSAGFIPSPLGNGQYISRIVKVPATNPPTLFSKAIVATGPISFGGNALVDSFDSRIGGYNTATNRGALGSIATDSRANPAVSVGNGKIYGTVNTGPGGAITLGSGGGIGDVAWNASHNGIEDPSWTNNDMNVAFPSNAPPTGAFTIPNVLPGSNTLVLSTTNLFQLPTLNIGGGVNVLLITTNVILWVAGDFRVQGNGYISILPGASLKLYVAGNTAIGGGGVVNGAGLASSFSYIGLSSNTSFSYSGRGAFVGTINAPQADISMSGNVDVYGAIICKTFSGSGSAGVHYDVSLATGSGLIATAWIEL